jgi:amino acid adenylation domain-containing protein
VTIPELFWARVDEGPDLPAVIEDDVALTYAALGERTAAYAALLDIAPGDRVGLLLDHGATTVAAALATMSAGGIYVPLDPRYPAARLAGMVEQAQVSVVLTTGAHRALADRLAGNAVVLDVATAPAAVERPDRWPTPEAPAYILHTSGSTGRPKGVVQTHRTVLHQVRLHRENLALTPDDRLSVVSSYSFDMAVTDTFAALLTGACSVPVDVRALGLTGLADALRRHRVSVYHSTPTVFRYLADCLADSPDPVLPDLRVVLLGGEAVTTADLARARRHQPAHGVLVNGYGATEISFAVQNHLPLAEATSDHTVVPIGRPLDGVRITLLAPDGTPAGTTGEIAISSDYLGDYWADPAESASRFDTDADGVRRYRTGDLAELLPDGRLVYLGRRDRQLKIRGHRVEPGEVEVALGALPGVARTAVVADREHVLRGFVTGDADPAALRSALAAQLPDHLVPTTIDVVDDLPLTPTGKIDARALLAGRPRPVTAAHAPAPEGLENRIAAVWSAVLNHDTVGLHDRFFDIGGHSLLAATAHRHLVAELGREFPLTAFYAHPTVAQLAGYLRTGERNDTTAITDRMARRAQNRRSRRH